VADIFHQQRRLWVRLHEKGGKFHEMPCHHTLEGYLAEYIERAWLGEAGRVPLFQAIKVRPYGRGEAQLNGERFHRTNAWQMVRHPAASIHWLRHAHASHAIDNGAPITLVSATLGHADLKTTSVYAHARPGESSGRYLKTKF
jgi:integrase/recombinase XerC